MNTIYFKLEEELKKKQEKYTKLDINMFDEIILGNMPNIYNYYNLTNNNQKGGSYNVDKYKIKLYTPLITDLFYKKIFKTTNYTNYKNKMIYEKLYKKYNFKNNSITLLNTQYDDVYFKDYPTKEILINDIKIKKHYDFINYIFKASVSNDATYNTVIEYVNDIINNLNDNGDMIIEINIFLGNNHITDEFMNNLVKQFEKVDIFYFHDPTLLTIAPKIICINKQKSDNIFNKTKYEEIINEINKASEYNYNFIKKFILYDDLLKESILYKLMTKF